MRQGAWRLLRLLIHALHDALLPVPTLRQIADADPALTRNLREGRRRRCYQPVTLQS